MYVRFRPQPNRFQLVPYISKSDRTFLTKPYKTPNFLPPPPISSSRGSYFLSAFLLGLGVTATALIVSSDNKENEKSKIQKQLLEKYPGTISEFPKDYKLPTQKLKAPSPNKIPVVLVACGSFSPITIMHLRLLEMCKDYFTSSGYEVIGGYFSPVGDAYKKKGLVNAIDRTNMALLATKDSDWIMIDTWEASLDKWSPTIQVLDHFSKELNSSFPNNKNKIHVIFVCGSDLLESFNSPGVWAEEDIQRICDFGLAVVTREGANPSNSIWKNDLLYINRTQIHLIHQWIPNDISSTLVRLGISRGLSIKYLLPHEVVDYIKDRGLYREEVEDDKFSRNTFLPQK